MGRAHFAVVVLLMLCKIIPCMVLSTIKIPLDLHTQGYEVLLWSVSALSLVHPIAFQVAWLLWKWSPGWLHKWNCNSYASSILDKKWAFVKAIFKEVWSALCFLRICLNVFPWSVYLNPLLSWHINNKMFSWNENQGGQNSPGTLAKLYLPASDKPVEVPGLGVLTLNYAILDFIL